MSLAATMEGGGGEGAPGAAGGGNPGADAGGAGAGAQSGAGGAGDSGGAPAGGGAAPTQGGGEAGAWRGLSALELAPELQAWAKGKGYDRVEDPHDLVKQLATSYHSLEQLKRVSEAELMRVPRDTALDSEPMRELFKKLGLPEKGELGDGGYDLPEIPGVEPDADLRPEFAKWAHEAGLNNAQASVVLERFMGLTKSLAAEQEAAASLERANGVRALRKAKGDGFDAFDFAATTVAKARGLSDEDVARGCAALGTERFLGLLGDLGLATGTHRPADDGGNTRRGDGPMTAAEAKEKLAELQGDPAWRKSWLAGDPRKVAMVKDLNRIATTAK